MHLILAYTTYRCGACWLYEAWTVECGECGGDGASKACPVCGGRCGRRWVRNAEMSHTFQEAHWDGACALPAAEQQTLVFRQMDMDPDALADALADTTLRPPVSSPPTWATPSFCWRDEL